MDKLEFITRQLAKAQTKRYEHYVVHRIHALLNDLRVKFVTQQFVSRPEGRAVTDMYFPQLGIHVEVDEGFHKRQIDADKLREADIINATGHQILRVDVTRDIESINSNIDKIVSVIRSKIDVTQDFEPWDMEAEMNPQTYIEKGYIDVSENVAFRTIADGASCFGKDYSAGMQKAWFPHPVEPNKYLWFLKLYENEQWNNQLSADEETITEFSKDPNVFREHIDRNIRETDRIHSRIVFARVKGPLGDLMYRFKGEYKMDLEATNYEVGCIYRRIGTRVKTYQPGDERLTTEGLKKSAKNIEEFYRESIRSLSVAKRLKLASLILLDLAENGTVGVESAKQNGRGVTESEHL